jgi:CheY-like chemotaxis protein/HPt (histidine-containing phosphotransfer) domain-containing protein
MEIDAETLAIFYDELKDRMGELHEVVEGNKTSYDGESLNSIFRLIHTIKGNTKALGLQNLSDVSHQIETTLIPVRDEQKVVAADQIYSLAMSYLDHMDDFLKYEHASCGQGTFDFSKLIQQTESFFDAEGSTKTPGKEKPTVLIVEDDEALVEVIDFMLKEYMDCQIDSCANGKDALQLAQGRKYDLIFADYHMPLVNGLEVISYLRGEDNANRATPIVFISGAMPHIPEGQNVEDVFFLDKPLAADRIVKYAKMALKDIL